MSKSKIIICQSRFPRTRLRAGDPSTGINVQCTGREMSDKIADVSGPVINVSLWQVAVQTNYGRK